MPETPQVLDGQHLTLDEYVADFRAHFWQTDSSGGWKLERGQTFREPGNPSWDASAEGDWEKAMALLHEGREEVRRYQQKIRDHGFEFRRVRIIEKPYSPYLIWELNSLLIRHQYGERIRVLPVTEIQDLEHGRSLPEIVVLGTEVVYQVRYDHTGLAVGATRSLDPRAVRHWTALVRGLYERSENLPDFFRREIAGRQPVRPG